jgi:hypothetical protein
MVVAARYIWELLLASTMKHCDDHSQAGTSLNRLKTLDMPYHKVLAFAFFLRQTIHDLERPP